MLLLSLDLQFCRSLYYQNASWNLSVKTKASILYFVSISKHGILHKMITNKLMLARRSLVILTGDARYKFKHGISKDLIETTDSGIIIERDKRISFTFREIIAWEVAENATCDGNKQ